jgi:hypothetical protein
MVTKANNTVLDLENPSIDALDMGGNVITNHGIPLSDNDVATKLYVDNAGGGGGTFLPLAGGIMSGQINMDGKNIINLAFPGFDGDAANKLYVDGFLSKGGGVMIGNINMDGHFVFNLPTPILAASAATKGYVDGLVGTLVVNTPSSAQQVIAQNAFPTDNTIPQQSEGDEISALNTTITPTNVNNLLKVEFHVVWSHTSSTAKLLFALFRDATANALAGTITSSSFRDFVQYTFYLTAGSLAATTFKVRIGSQGGVGTTTINNSTLYGGTILSHMTVTEIVV